ncbi:PDZRN4 [Symbiodinium sp. CCMP2456]|nr:PDZRN4 [Symbiodinium sp. CCMP2456]
MVSEQALEAKPATYVVKWDYIYGSVLDGEYVEAGTRNGKPMYKQRNGPGIIFHESYGRKLPEDEGAPGWKVGFDDRSAHFNSHLRAVKKGSVKDDVPPEGKYWIQGRQNSWIGENYLNLHAFVKRKVAT